MTWLNQSIPSAAEKAAIKKANPQSAASSLGLRFSHLHEALIDGLPRISQSFHTWSTPIISCHPCCGPFTCKCQTLGSGRRSQATCALGYPHDNDGGGGTFYSQCGPQLANLFEPQRQYLVEARGGVWGQWSSPPK